MAAKGMGKMVLDMFFERSVWERGLILHGLLKEEGEVELADQMQKEPAAVVLGCAVAMVSECQGCQVMARVAVRELERRLGERMLRGDAAATSAPRLH